MFASERFRCLSVNSNMVIAGSGRPAGIAVVEENDPKARDLTKAIAFVLLDF